MKDKVPIKDETQPITVSMEDDSNPEYPVRKFRTLQDLYETTQVLFVEDPTTYEEAVKKKEWRQAMEEKIITIEKNNTWY
jgi:hypothetical protein